MSDGVPYEVPSQSTPPMPEDMAAALAASMNAGPMPSRHSMRAKVLGAILIAGIGVGASAMSCVGQSFSLRQARALEGIEQQLIQLRAGCTSTNGSAR